MPSHKEKRFLPYKPEELFDLVAKIEDYPQFLPWCLAARVRQRSEDEVTADLIIGYKIFRESFTSVVSLERPRKIIVHYRSGPLSHLKNEWTFRKEGEGCRLEFHVDFDFHSPLLSSLMNVFFDRALRKMVSSFEERAEELYGAR